MAEEPYRADGGKAAEMLFLSDDLSNLEDLQAYAKQQLNPGEESVTADDVIEDVKSLGAQLGEIAAGTPGTGYGVADEVYFQAVGPLLPDVPGLDRSDSRQEFNNAFAGGYLAGLEE